MKNWFRDFLIFLNSPGKPQDKQTYLGEFKAGSVTYQKGWHIDDLPGYTEKNYHKVIRGKVKERKIKNLVNWDSDKYNLVKLTPISKEAKVKIINKESGDDPRYEYYIVFLKKGLKKKYTL